MDLSQAHSTSEGRWTSFLRYGFRVALSEATKMIDAL